MKLKKLFAGVVAAAMIATMSFPLLLQILTQTALLVRLLLVVP